MNTALSIGFALALLDGESFAGGADRDLFFESALAQKAKAWWAFQPVKEPQLPRAGGRGGIDSFLNQKIEAAGLECAPPADRLTLLRRATFDLTGLPPTPGEAAAFLEADSPGAFARVVDRLLASPAYGQRWARHWLDVVRYADYHDADAKARTASCEPLEAWRYRDWVVDSLNQDLPFDQFIVHQLAGDLLPNPVGLRRLEAASATQAGLRGAEAASATQAEEAIYPAGLIATAFLVNGAWDRGDADKEKMVSDMVDDQVDTVGKAFLGLTLGCARCHDHKFDPIPQKDYYRLAGVFASTQRALRPFFDIDPKTETRFMWVYQRMFDLHYTANLLESDPGSKPEQAAHQVKKFRDELTYVKTVPYPGEKVPAGPASKGAEPAGAKPAGQAAAPKKTLPADLIANSERVRNAGGGGGPRKRIDPKAPFLNSVYDAGVWFNDSEPDLTFFDAKPGVPRDLPLFKGGNLNAPGDQAPRGFPLVLAKGPAAFRNGSGRLELGERIFTDAAPLSARVIVNRVWGWHFGTHLVGTPSDFGAQGLPPSHPELLDDLSARFIASGWSLKWLHREIMLSATYRQSSHPRAEAMDADPTNQWLWRMNPRRLDIEAYRDSLLQAAGTLDRTMYGPSADIDSGTRRTVYASLSRGRSSADVMKLYDAPQPMQHSPMRHVTINPQQALFVMNSGFVQGLAFALAKAVDTRGTREEVVRALYRKVFARDADQEEVALGVKYLTGTEGATVARYAQALLSTNEMIFWP